MADSGRIVAVRPTITMAVVMCAKFKLHLLFTRPAFRSRLDGRPTDYALC